VIVTNPDRKEPKFIAYRIPLAPMGKPFYWHAEYYEPGSIVRIPSHVVPAGWSRDKVTKKIGPFVRNETTGRLTTRRCPWAWIPLDESGKAKGADAEQLSELDEKRRSIAEARAALAEEERELAEFEAALPQDAEADTFGVDDDEGADPGEGEEGETPSELDADGEGGDTGADDAGDRGKEPVPAEAREQVAGKKGKSRRAADQEL
jgi:hypothetical protein